MLFSVIISEYSSPKRRGSFQTMFKVSVFIGVLICHAFIHLLNWKQITYVGIFWTILPLIITCYWPESPAWLASKAQFDECKKSWMWLYGKSDKSIKEMNSLISAQRERLSLKQIINKNYGLKLFG